MPFVDKLIDSTIRPDERHDAAAVHRNQTCWGESALTWHMGAAVSVADWRSVPSGVTQSLAQSYAVLPALSMRLASPYP